MRSGDKVLLDRIPDGVIADGNRFPETLALFEKAVGQRFTIRASSKAAGMVEIWIAADGKDSDDPCADSLFVEEKYLEPPAGRAERIC